MCDMGARFNASVAQFSWALHSLLKLRSSCTDALHAVPRVQSSRCVLIRIQPNRSSTCHRSRCCHVAMAVCSGSHFGGAHMGERFHRGEAQSLGPAHDRTARTDRTDNSQLAISIYHVCSDGTVTTNPRDCWKETNRLLPNLHITDQG